MAEARAWVTDWRQKEPWQDAQDRLGSAKEPLKEGPAICHLNSASVAPPS